MFRENGIQKYLGDAGSQAEIDSLAEIIGDYTLSVTEVADRISDAQRVVANTDPNVRAALNTYYADQWTRIWSSTALIRSAR